MTLLSRFEQVLDREPWLRPFIEDGDKDLELARRRFEQAETAALEQLELEGTTAFRRLEKTGGILTTALDPEGRRL